MYAYEEKKWLFPKKLLDMLFGLTVMPKVTNCYNVISI